MVRGRVRPMILGPTIAGLLIGTGLVSAQIERAGSPSTIPNPIEWRFSEPQPDWKSSLPILAFEAARLERTVDALRVTLPEGSALARRMSAGGIYVDLPDSRREDWPELVVRARTTSSVHTMRVGLNAPEDVPPPSAPQASAQALFRATFQASGGVTPIVRDGLIHTYRIHLDWGPQRTGSWRRIGLQFQALVPGSIDILSISLIPAAAQHERTQIAETTLEPPRLKSDFALFRQALEEGHPALHRYTAKQEMDALFAGAEAQLTRPMTLLQFRNILAPVRAAIKDGYGIAATFQGDEISTIVNSAKQFPLALTFESSRAFVVLNQGVDDRVKPGMEVLAINGQSLAEILKRILPALGQYGDVRTWPMYQLGISGGFFRRGTAGRTGFSDAYRLYIADPKTFSTTLLDPLTRKTVVVDLAGVTVAEAAANATMNPVNRDVLTGLETLRRLSSPPSIRYLDDSDTAILVPSWSVGAPTFLKEVFAGLRSRKTKSLIIDLRGNTGGFDQIPVLLFSYLTSKEFRSFERVYMKTYQPSFSQYTVIAPTDPAKDPYYGSAAGIWKADPSGGWLMTEKYPIIGAQKPSENRFDGGVYVLIDGGGISGTAEFCATVDFYKRATFIGEESGGAAEGDTGGGDLSLTLPESHLQVRIPGEAYFSVVDKSNRRRGTLPKHTVIQTIDDLAGSRDTALEFTLKLIRSGNGR